MTASVFGQVRLGYVAIETDRFTDWRRFAEDGLGMHVDHDDRDTMRFRLDDNHTRVLLARGPAEDATAIGWQADDHEALDTVAARVTAAGLDPVEVGGDELAERGAERLVRVPGPKGLPQEVFVRSTSTPEPLKLRGTTAFVTGSGGMGHVAITSKKPAHVRGYFTHLLDARLTDYIDETIQGVKLKIRFLRLNDRHHSVAIAATRPIKLDPIRTRIQHVNVQVAELDDVTGSYERLKALDFSMALDVGQHTNDREISYYALTPSGFEWEVGWNPITVDEATWQPTTHQGISVWGHGPVHAGLGHALGQAKVGLRSLRRPEDTVPALSGSGIADGRPDPTRAGQA